MAQQIERPPEAVNGHPIGVVLPVEALRKIDALATANDRSRSAEIRRAVRQYLEGAPQAA